MNLLTQHISSMLSSSIQPQSGFHPARPEYRWTWNKTDQLLSLAKAVFADLYFFLSSHTGSSLRDPSLLFSLGQKQLLFRSSLQKKRGKADPSGKTIPPLKNDQKEENTHEDKWLRVEENTNE